jgi:thiamine monophosphate synthase
MFPSTTKSKPLLAGPAHLARYLADPVASPIPHLAIGGITPHNIHELVQIGCRGIAVSAAVCSSPQPERICAAFVTALASAPQSA